MPQAADILARCDQKGTPLKDALRRYAQANPAAPYAIQADLEGYGQATRTYLAWSAGLLKALEDACSSRSGARAAVDALIARCVAYFDAPDRWPAVPAMDLPLRLMLPAYYTARAAQHVSCLFHPHLLDVALGNAHAFAIEILGQPAADAICRCKNDDLGHLPRADDDLQDAISLHYRSFPSSRMASQLAAARNAKRPQPAPLPPTSSVVPPASVSPSVATSQTDEMRWIRRLGDSRIVLQRSNVFDSDYSSGHYSSSESLLDLYANGRYRLLESSFVRVSIPGMSIGGPRSQETRGTWSVRSTGGGIALVLAADGGARSTLTLADGGSGAIIVNDRTRAWHRL